MLKPRPRNCDTFMNHLAPNDRSGTNLKSVDGAALEAKDRLKKPYNINEPWDARSGDYAACEKLDRRKNRGGATFRPEDTMG